MIRSFLRGILYAEWNTNTGTDDCKRRVKIERELPDIHNTLSDIYFNKKGIGNGILSVSYSDGFWTTEFVVIISGVPVIGILCTTGEYHQLDYTDDQELIQETLDEVYLLMDKKYDADQQKKRSDIEKAKDALTRHKKYSRPWLYD